MKYDGRDYTARADGFVPGVGGAYRFMDHFSVGGEVQLPYYRRADNSYAVFSLAVRPALTRCASFRRLKERLGTFAPFRCEGEVKAAAVHVARCLASKQRRRVALR
jgi:hypothetical protein